MSETKLRLSKLQKIHHLPWWMNTLWGRWISEHWPPAIALREDLTSRSEYDTCKFWVERDADAVMRSLGAYIQSNFQDPFKDRLLSDFKNWQQSVATEQRAYDKLIRRRP